jgi:hypothetical protein
LAHHEAQICSGNMPILRHIKMVGWAVVTVGLLCGLQAFCRAEDSSSPAVVGVPGTKHQTQDSAEQTDFQSVIERTMRPYDGPTHAAVDPSTLHGKVMCGYQGWFTAEGDGANAGWTHWRGRNGFKPGSCEVDFWPDVSELGPDERYATSFVLADGKKAEVFSAFNEKTVLRHFQWMRDYGIDGVFVQRFLVSVSSPEGLRNVNTVLDHCRKGANLYGRTYAVMYDLSGMKGGQMQRVIEDWKLLVDRMQITKDPAYLHHNGKPVVAVWGFGFNDHRNYTPKEGLELVKFLKEDPHYGGCTVLLGVPTYWRTLDHDCVNDETLHELILKADIVSPWTVGRYTNPEQGEKYARQTMRPDIAWCGDHGKEFLPVVFPGFSWHNMQRSFPLDQIPRLKGKFLWEQYVQAKKAGATMIYQAMFDEVNEGTAIFKCTDEPPVGASQFLTFEGLPSDFYLTLVGNATRMIRGELPLTEQIPQTPLHASAKY